MKFLGYILSLNFNVALFEINESTIFLSKDQTAHNYTLINFCDRCVILKYKNEPEFKLYSGDYHSPENSESESKIYVEPFTDENTTAIISKDTVDFIKASDLINVMYQAASTPAYDYFGNQIGYRLYELDENSIFKKIGLIDYDMITSIDGVELSNPKNSIEALKKIKDLDNFEVELVRYGLPIKIQIKIK